MKRRVTRNEIELSAKQIRQLAGDALILAAYVRLYTVPGERRVRDATKRTLKLLPVQEQP